jgi:uncharacterized membrane protein
MSKCRPDCCSSKSSDDGILTVIGLIALVAVVYGIVKAIMHVIKVVLHYLIIVGEITGITAACAAVIALFVVTTIKVIRWRRTRNAEITGYISTGTEMLPILATGETGKPLDPGRLFAEAIAADGMELEFINEILNIAMERNDQ